MTHPYLPTLHAELERGRVSRREFLRTATLLGMGATAAYAAAGLPKPASAQPAAPAGGRIRIGMRVHEVKDPMTVTWVEASNLARQTNDFLVRTEQDNITRGVLAKTWDASDDLKTWTFHLDPAAKWRSGRPFTAADAAWNIKRALDPKTGSSILGLMKSYMITETPTGETKDGKPVMASALWDANAIETPDDHTLRLNLKAAQLAVPEHLFHYPFAMLDPADNGAFKLGMNGTGPFEMIAYEPGRRAVMRGRKDYWRGPVPLETLEFIDLGSDSGAAIAAMASHQVDGLYEVDITQLDATTSACARPCASPSTARRSPTSCSAAPRSRPSTPTSRRSTPTTTPSRRSSPTRPAPRPCWRKPATPTASTWRSPARTSPPGKVPPSP
jgi:peptide/nickel transport system substrate-binding protein